MVLVQVKNGDDHILSATFWYRLITFAFVVTHMHNRTTQYKSNGGEGLKFHALEVSLTNNLSKSLRLKEGNAS